MTNEGEFESADPVAASPRKPARSTLVVALLLVLVGAIAAFVVAHLGPPDPDPGADGPAAPDPDAAGLRAHGAPPRPVPPGTVDVTVVEQAGGAPVAGVEVAARRTLTDDASLASTATTDDTGRARLRGEWPAFVELRSDVWTAVPLRAAVDERTRLRIEVVRQAPFDVRLVDERSGLPVAGWTVGSVDGEGASLGVARADAGGAAALAPSRRPPAIVAATDGGSHLRAFFLTAIPRRTGARLEVSPDVRTTIVRCLDEAGGPVGGALLSVASGNSGISVVADERGEAVVESASRTGLTLVASAPGRSPRTLHVDAASPRTVVLLPTLSRRFRVRTADGTRVPEGASLRGFTRGPLAYGIDGAGTEFRGRTEGETCVVPDLPAGPFEGLVLVEGDGISTLARVLAGDDASQPIELVVGPPRTFTLVGIVSSDPTRTATAVVRVDGVRTCSGDGFDAARDLRDAFEGGLPIDPLGQCFVVRGPDARLTLPRSTEPRRVEILTGDGAFACFVAAPDDVGGRRAPAFLDTGARFEPAALEARIEWSAGGAAEMIVLEVRADTSSAEPTSATTDSTGTALFRLPPGRYVVGATLEDGRRCEGEGPFVVPSRTPLVVRLRVIDR